MEEEVQHKEDLRGEENFAKGMGHSIGLSSNPIKGARMERNAHL
jgi:hypothetical protein